jgi:hypothetical protein
MVRQLTQALWKSPAQPLGLPPCIPAEAGTSRHAHYTCQTRDRTYHADENLSRNMVCVSKGVVPLESNIFQDIVKSEKNLYTS